MNVKKHFQEVIIVLLLVLYVCNSELSGASWLFYDDDETEGDSGHDVQAPVEFAAPRQQEMYLKTVNAYNYPRQQVNTRGSFVGQNHANSQPKSVKEPQKRINEWLFGELTPEEEEEKRREAIMLQETVQFNLQRHSDVRNKQAEERRRDNERRGQDANRRVEEKERNTLLQQMQKQDELAKLKTRNENVEKKRFEDSERNRFDDGGRLKKEELQNRKLEVQLRKEPILQPPSDKSFQHRRPQPNNNKVEKNSDDDDDDNPPSEVVFNRRKSFFSGLFGTSWKLTQSPSNISFFLSILVLLIYCLTTLNA